MSKRLSDRIASRARDRKSTIGNANRAAFFALRADVMAAMKDGWSIRMIWETLHAEGKIGFSYSTFTRYVQRLALVPAIGPHSAPKVSEKSRNPPAGLPAFKFDSSGKKEDLI